MKKFWLLIFIGVLSSQFISAQTTVFSDNFNTSQGTSYTTSGVIGSSSWTVNRSGDDWGGKIDQSQLDLTNDASTTSNSNGWVFVNTSTSSFSLPYNTTLSLNTGLVTWNFNMRQIRSDPSGFGSGNYGVAFILAGSSQTANNTGSGYAVVLGQSGSTDPIRLASYNNGLAGTLTNIISSNTSGLTDFGAEYLSIRVTYDPSTNQWELFLRNDGGSGFTDPTTGTLTSQGTATDSTYTGSSLGYLGGYWQGSTTANQTAFFDNVSVIVNNVASPTITVSPSSLSGFTYVEGSGPSTSQSYNLSGSNLSPAAGNLTVTGTTNYEVSTDNSTFSGSVNVAYTGGTLSATPIYVRLKAGLTAGTYNGENVANSGGSATTQNVTCNGSVTPSEPTNHATSFSGSLGSRTYSNIVLTWTDASGGIVPDGYLIKVSNVGYGSISDPVDGTAETNKLFVQNVNQGVQTASFTELTGSTTYYFKIYPYKGSGSNINYKTDGTVPQFSLPTSALPSGLLFEHNFDYGSNIADYGWSLHSGGSTPINTTSGLTYTGYISSGIGNAANITGTSDDLNQGFVDQNSSGSIYLSALVSVTEAADNITGDYFLHLGDRTDPTTFTSFCARVFARVDASGNVNFGLSNTSTATWGATNYLKNTTYLLTVKYALNTSGNDDASLWIFSSGVPSDEIAAGTPEVSITGQTGQDIVDAIGLRQASSNQPDLILDGIRISTSWSQAPLPVELTSFTGTAKGKVVSLNWSTKTEVNNYGFEILRSDKTGEWEKIGFVAGSGNSNSPKEYSYTDSKTTGYGKYSYKLKQIDNDGKYTYTKEVEVDLGIVKEYELSQNYPNPFNPSTVIRYAIPQSGNVKLSVYNILGQEVKVLTEGYKEAGSYEVTFDGEGLGSGLYIYKLESGKYSKVMKMTLIK